MWLRIAHPPAPYMTTIDFSEARNLKRFPFLDAARGVACIGVVACHCGLAYLFHWYWGVMDFFFVMSGFLITRSLVSNCDKGRGTFAFLLYRALRLLPAYLTVMLLYEITVFLVTDRKPLESLPYILFYQNTDLIFGSVERFPRVFEMIPYWSLVLEEHYYMLWGVFFCVFAFAKLRINLVTVGLTLLMLGLAILMRRMGVFWWTLPARFDGFLLGSMAGIIIFMPKKVDIGKNWARWLMGAGWVISAVALVRLVWSGSISYQDLARFDQGRWIDVTCFSIVSVVLVLGMVKIDIRRLHFGRLQDGCAFLGLISYETYLAHFPIVVMLQKGFDFSFNGGKVVLFLVTMVISCVVAYFMHRVLTVPALKRREEIYAFFTRLAARFRSERVALVADGNPDSELSSIPVKSDGQRLH